MLGWGGIAVIFGAFFDMSIFSTFLVGALLGPLGFLAVLLVGTSKKWSDFTKEQEIKLPQSRYRPIDGMFQ